MAEVSEQLVVVTFRQLLKPIALIAGCVVAFGIIYLCDKFVRALFGTVTGVTGWIPFLNKVVATPIHKIEQKLTQALGAAEAAIDEQIASYLHTLAHLPAMLGNALLSTAEDLWIIVAFAATLLDPREWKKLYDSLVGKTQAQLLPIKTKANAANAHAKAITQSVAQGVMPRLRTVEHDVNRVIPKEIGNLRGQVKEIEDGAIDTWKWIRSHPTSIASGAFAATVAWAIGRLGMGWTRCTNWKRIGREVCQTPASDIEALLGLVLGTVAIGDLRDLVKAAQKVERTAVAVIEDVLGV